MVSSSCVLLWVASVSGYSAPEPIDLSDFWTAATPAEIRRAIDTLVAGDPDFTRILEAVERGPRYVADVPRGSHLYTRKNADGTPHHYGIRVPDDYDPAERWPVRFYLHGGMGCPRWKACDGSWIDVPRFIVDPEAITVFPSGWWDSIWWGPTQVENLTAILDDLRRTYNTDENRVHMVGASDGGTACFFYAFRFPDLWAAYVPMIASPVRLTNRTLRVDGQMHLPNLGGQSFFWLNGERDSKFPGEFVEPYADLFAKTAASVKFHADPKCGHDCNFLPYREQEITQFCKDHVRDPLPDRIVWATERTDRYHRRSWIIIDDIASSRRPVTPAAILPRWYGGQVSRMKAPRARGFGSVVVERRGNRVDITSENVTKYRLFLSPREFDFTEPVVIHTNGVVSHEGPVQPSVRTLLEWAARDRDRTRVFGAEVAITVPRTKK